MSDLESRLSGGDEESPLLSIRNLSVDYVGRSAVRAVDDLSLDIRRGEIFGLLGESGSGKSTAILAALRLLPPPAVIVSGQVMFEGVDLLTLDEGALRRLRFRRIAVVLQSAMNALSPVLSIGEQITDVILAHEAASRGDAWARAGELLELVGIEAVRLRSYPHELSGGMRQRVGLAVALALRPALVVLDEPTTALDVVVERQILQRLAELSHARGFSILLVSHDVSSMLEFCDRLGVLYAGRVCEVAPRADLESGARHPYTRGLLDSLLSRHQAGTRLVGIPGAPPDIARPPSGCRFHPRCAFRVDLCEHTIPPLFAPAAGRALACHRPLQLVPPDVDASVPPRRTP